MFVSLFVEMLNAAVKKCATFYSLHSSAIFTVSIS